MSKNIITKRCTQCKEIKPILEFHKGSGKYGHRSICKNCCKTYRQSPTGKVVQKRYKQSEKGRNANKRYEHTEKSKARYKRYRQTTKRKTTQKRYNQSEKGKATIQATVKRFKARHPNYVKAHNAVNNAIATGTLSRLDSLLCHYYLQNPDCEKQAEEYHHHFGYAPEHWLDVIPVCIKCHTKLRSIDAT